MGVLTMICFVITGLSVIRQKVFCEDVIDFFRGFGNLPPTAYWKFPKSTSFSHQHRVKRIMEKEGVTEQLKNENPLKWVQRVNGIKARVEEVMQKM